VQVKIQETLEMRPTLGALKELVTEYDSLAVVIPEMLQVTRSPTPPFPLPQGGLTTKHPGQVLFAGENASQADA